MDNEQKAMALGLVGVLLVGVGFAGLAGILPLEITGVSVSVAVSSYHECSGAYRVLFNATVSGGA